MLATGSAKYSDRVWPGWSEEDVTGRNHFTRPITTRTRYHGISQTASHRVKEGCGRAALMAEHEGDRGGEAKIVSQILQGPC